MEETRRRWGWKDMDMWEMVEHQMGGARSSAWRVRWWSGWGSGRMELREKWRCSTRGESAGVGKGLDGGVRNEKNQELMS